MYHIQCLFLILIMPSMIHSPMALASNETEYRFQEFTGHTDAVYSPSFSADGKRVLTSSKDWTARIWDTETGQELFTLRDHSDTVYSAQFSPDNTQIMTSSLDGITQIWDVASGKALKILHGVTDETFGCWFSADKKKLIIVRPGSVRIVDASTGFVLNTLYFNKNEISSAALLTSLEETMSGYPRSWIKHQNLITCTKQGQLKIWNINDLNTRDVKDIKEIRISEIPLLSNFRIYNEICLTRLEVGAGTLYLLQEGKKIRQITSTSPIVSVSGSRGGGSIIACKADGTLDFIDTFNLRTNRSISSQPFDLIYSSHFSPDGARIVRGLGNKSVQILSTESGSQLTTLSGHQGTVYSAQFSPNGKTIVTASADKTVRIYDAITWQLIRSLEGHKGAIYSAQFSPDGKKIVTASADQIAKIWDVNTGKEILSLGGSLNPGHTHEVTSAAFSPDGKRVITGSYDHTARIWDASTGETLAVLRGHTAGISGVNFSPEGERAVTTSYDHTARVWFLRPQYDFDLEQLPKTLTSLQNNAYHQGGLKNFYIELQNIAAKEALNPDQKRLLFLTLQSYLNDPRILTEQMHLEVLPSLQKTAHQLAKIESITSFSDLIPSIPVMQMALSIMRASVLAMKESGGLNPQEQESLAAVLRAIEESRIRFSLLKPNKISAIVSECRDLTQSCSANSQIIESWAQSNDLRSSYARVFEILAKYLENI